MAYDYTALQADLLVAGKRPDYVGAKVQRFIAEGEVRIRERCEGYPLSTVLTDANRTPPANIYTLPNPTRIVQVRHVIPIAATYTAPLDAVDETLVAVHGTDNAVTMYCARPDGTLVIAGSPGVGVTFNCNYIGLPVELAAVATNQLLTDHQLLYLNAALISLHRETRESDQMQFCINEFTDLVNNINRKLKKLLGGPRATAAYNTSWQSSY
jgi:hypothetical protein